MRALMTGLVVLMATTVIAAAGKVGEDGLHKQPWFTVTFKDVKEGLGSSKAGRQTTCDHHRAARLHLLQEAARGRSSAFLKWPSTSARTSWSCSTTCSVTRKSPTWMVRR